MTFKNRLLKTMSTSNAGAVRFTDPCYPRRLVRYINETLERDDLDATEQWVRICLAEHAYYSCKGKGVQFEALPHQLTLETAPREFLLSIIRDKRTRGYEKLMDMFGMVY